MKGASQLLRDSSLRMWRRVWMRHWWSLIHITAVINWNPMEAQTCAFHLRNKQASRQLQVRWSSVDLEHWKNPKYLGVTLDQSLTFKQHCLNTKLKVCGRNNILRWLTGSTWGARPKVVRTSALSLAYDAGKYASAVWYRSAHAKQVDVTLNESARIVTRCLQPNPVNKIILPVLHLQQFKENNKHIKRDKNL